MREYLALLGAGLVAVGLVAVGHRRRRRISQCSNVGLHDEGTPRVIYHVVQKSLWDAAQAAGVHYFPPRYDIEGFIHATHDANLLLGVLNWRHPKHGFIYKKVPGTFLCLAIDTAVLTSPVKMEGSPKDANPVKFPHIYGPIAPLSCVTRQMDVVRDPSDGTFLSIAGLCQ